MKIRILSLLVIILLVSSCRSKKKTLERENIVSELEAVTSTDAVISEAFELNSTINTNTEIETVSTNEVEHIEADSTGNVTVTVEKTNTGYVKTYTGVKSIKVSSEKVDKNKKETIAENTNITGTKDTKINNESLIKVKTESKTRKTDVEIKSTSTWFWIILLIIAIVYMILRKNIGFLP